MSLGIQSRRLSHLRCQRISNHPRINCDRDCPRMGTVPLPHLALGDFFYNTANLLRDRCRVKRHPTNHRFNPRPGSFFSDRHARRVERIKIDRHPFRQTIGEQTQD